MAKILIAPNSILTTRSKPVKKIDHKVKELISKLEKTLIEQKDPQGVGLAAPQIGVGFRVFVMRPKSSAKTEVFLNPKVLGLSKNRASYSNKNKAAKKKGKKKALEGCLSVPRIWSPVPRANEVEIEYQNLEGEIRRKKFTGFKAVIIQHEIDHLDGILFTQRAARSNSPLYEENDGKLTKLKLP